MRGWLARWVIGRCADDGSPLPRWVERRLRRDRHLAEYQRATRELTERLRDDAPDWAANSTRTAADVTADAAEDAAISGPGETVRRTSRIESSRRRVIPAVAVIGSLAAVCLVLWLPTPQPVERGPATAAVPATPASPQDLQIVRQFVRAQSTLAARAWQRGAAWGERLAAADPASLSAARWLSDGVRDVGNVSESAVRTTVRVFRNGVAGERQRWTDALQPLGRLLDRVRGALSDTAAGAAGPPDDPAADEPHDEAR